MWSRESARVHKCTKCRKCNKDWKLLGGRNFAHAKTFIFEIGKRWDLQVRLQIMNIASPGAPATRAVPSYRTIYNFMAPLGTTQRSRMLRLFAHARTHTIFQFPLSGEKNARGRLTTTRKVSAGLSGLGQSFEEYRANAFGIFSNLCIPTTFYCSNIFAKYYPKLEV